MEDPLKDLLEKVKKEKPHTSGFTKMGFNTSDIGMDAEAFHKMMNLDPEELDKALKEANVPSDVQDAIHSIWLLGHMPGMMHELHERMELIFSMFKKLEKFNELPADCKDAEGTPLRPGDRLTGGTLGTDWKDVLAVHFSYATLSLVNKNDKDMEWSEEMLKKRKWVIDKEYALKQKVTKET